MAAGSAAMFQIGDSLREERIRRRLELVEVERETRIRAHHLRALEDEDFDLLPPGMYRRSFLREYAEFLGLDGSAFAREYDERFAPREPEPIAEIRRVSPRRRLRPAWIAAAGALVLVGAGIWALDRGGGPHTATPPATTTGVAGTQTTRGVHHHHAPKPPTPPARPVSLVLVASRGSCWISVRVGSASGPAVYEQTLQQGERVSFGLGKTLYIRLGAPWNLDARVGGKAVTLPAQTGDVVATRSGLR